MNFGCGARGRGFNRAVTALPGVFRTPGMSHANEDPFRAKVIQFFKRARVGEAAPLTGVSPWE